MVLPTSSCQELLASCERQDLQEFQNTSSCQELLSSCTRAMQEEDHWELEAAECLESQTAGR